MNTVGRVQSEWRPEGSNVNLQVPKSSGDGTMPFNVEKDLRAVGPLTKTSVTVMFHYDRTKTESVNTQREVRYNFIVV